MTAPATPEANNNNSKASLAVLSGSKLLVLDVSNDNDNVNDNDNDNEPQNQKVRTFDPYSNDLPICSLAWNHNQMVIATASGISTDDLGHDNIVLLSSQSGQTLDSFQHDADWKQQEQQRLEKNLGNCPATSVGFGGKSRYLCVGDASGAVCLWDLKKRLRVRQFFHTFSDRPDPSLQVSLDPTDTYVLSLSPSALYQYNLRDGQLVNRRRPPQDGNDIDVPLFTVFSISEKEPTFVAIGADDGRIFVHDIGNPNGALLEMAQHHSGEVTGLAFSPVHPNLVFSCGTDGTILVHNKTDCTSYRLGVENNLSSIVSMSLHASESTLAVGCKSGDVFVYNLDANGQSTTLVASHPATEPVIALSFAPPLRFKHKQKPKNTESVSKSNSVSTKSSETSSSSSKPKATIKKPSPAKPRAASPFARKLASLTAINREHKLKVAAKTTKSPPLSRAPLSPRSTGSNGVMRDTPMSPTSSTGSNKIERDLRSAKYSISKIKHNKDQIAPQTEEIREVVREEVENLQDEMEEQLRNLHIDMINQFHQQSQEFNSILNKHFEALERLTTENQQLRQENEQLRLGI